MLYHEIYGAGSPVVLIPGLGTDTTCWMLQLPALTPKHQVILLDNRGCPRSGMPTGRLTMEGMADDVAELLRHLGSAPAVVVGHSMGGGIAQHLALRHPELVRGLVLAGTSARFDPFAMHLIRVFDAWLREGVSRETFVRGLLPWLLNRPFFEDPKRIEAAVTMFVESAWPQPAEGYHAQVQALEGHDTRSRLPQLDKPVLVVTGSEDRLGPPAEARALASLLPDARLEILEGSSHSCIIDGAEEFNRLVLDFAARIYDRSQTSNFS